MPALRKVGKRLIPAVLCLALNSAIVFALTAASSGQTGLNEVHITPREKAPVAASIAPLKDIGGAMLHVVKADANLVLVPVSVTDGMERFVKGLSRDNFQVYDGKTPQQIKSFSSEDVPVSVGIIMDVSGSMANKIDRVREAVNQFCETANRQDEFFLIEFSDEPHLMTDFTSSPEEIEKELVFTHPKGRTSLLDAIYLGLGKMKEAKYQKRALLVISDGGDNHSRYDEKEMKAAALESDVS